MSTILLQKISKVTETVVVELLNGRELAYQDSDSSLNLPLLSEAMTVLFNSVLVSLAFTQGLS